MADKTVETFTIINELGLHARAAATFVKIANNYRSHISVIKDKLKVNGKSIMGVLMLAASKNTKLTIEAEGPDSEEAVKNLGKLIADKFGEEK